MLIRKGSQWQLHPYKVKYKQHGKEIEKWALPNKEWWTDFSDKWDHTEIIEFTEIEVTEEMQARFEEIRNMPEDFSDVYIDYVLTGDFPEEFPKNHPFMLIKSQKENNAISNYILDVDMRLIMQELGGL